MKKQNEKDFYKDWLNIPEDQRPPNYYQLLGIREFENDIGVIRRAALKQYAKAKLYQTSVYYEDCVRILHEISRAKVVLCNSEKKRIYDENLAQSSSTPEVGVEDQTIETDAWLSFRQRAEAIVRSAGGLNEQARKQVYAEAEQQGISWADVAAIVDELEMYYHQGEDFEKASPQTSKHPAYEGKDLYRDWLNIPDHQRPPSYYQLLGICDFENNHEVIKRAALARTDKIEHYITSENLEDCVRLLREISQAKANLLDPAKKHDYDEKLAQLHPQSEVTDGLSSFRKEAETMIRLAGELNEHVHSQIYVEAERRGIPLADVAAMVEELQLDWPYVQSSNQKPQPPQDDDVLHQNDQVVQDLHETAKIRKDSFLLLLWWELKTIIGNIIEYMPDSAKRILCAFILVILLFWVIWLLS